MKLPEESDLLRVFVGESDKFEGRPLYQAIVEEAMASGLSGATVLRGLMGFGSTSRLHTIKVLRDANKLSYRPPPQIARNSPTASNSSHTIPV